MKKIFDCRRTFISALGILCLTTLGIMGKFDTSMAIASVAAALCAANSWEGRSRNGK